MHVEYDIFQLPPFILNEYLFQITLKFSSPEEESLWFDQFERSRLPASVGHVSGLTTTGGSAGPSIGSNDNSDNSLERYFVICVLASSHTRDIKLPDHKTYNL